MSHPGPPRFLSVGESVELAPRDPDCDSDRDSDVSAAHDWRVVSRPEQSTATVGDGAVVHFAPDVPGIYRVELSATDGTYTQTVRAFPDPRREARVAATNVDGNLEGVEYATVIGQFNDFTMGLHQAEREDDEWVLDVALPPGEHEAIFAFDGDFDSFATAEVTIEGAGRPHIRLDGRCEGDMVVVTATARAAPNGSDPDIEFYFDDRDALERGDVTIDGEELSVPLDALPVLSRVHAVPVAERHGIADTLIIRIEDDEDRDNDVYFQRPADAPEWVRGTTIYEIFVREFAGETVETTFEEIERRVPYLESLGIDVVWFTPICESPTRHGYHITDLFDTASDLGTRTEFASLVERLHQADIRIVFDLVINHTSRDHPAFQLHRAGVPDYVDHYERIPTGQDRTDVDWAGDDAPGHYFNWTQIPNVNYDSLAVRKWMLDVIDEWAPIVDGFRCDVAWGVPHGFWKEVRERVKTRDEEFLLLDETVPRDPAFRENEFDIHYDTDLYSTLRDIGTGNAPASAIFDALADSQRHGYPDEALHMRYIDNHDEDRYVTECDDGTLCPAVAATLTLPGVPMIYSGQERGVHEQRGTMRWHDGDADLTDFHRCLVDLRQSHPALRSTDVEPVNCDVIVGESERVVAYKRVDNADDNEEELIVILNFESDPVTVKPESAVESTDLVSDDDVSSGDGVMIDNVVVLRSEADDVVNSWNYTIIKDF
jgi:cyclomaltodextrinase